MKTIILPFVTSKCSSFLILLKYVCCFCFVCPKKTEKGGVGGKHQSYLQNFARNTLLKGSSAESLIKF